MHGESNCCCQRSLSNIAARCINREILGNLIGSDAASVSFLGGVSFGRLTPSLHWPSDTGKSNCCCTDILTTVISTAGVARTCTQPWIASSVSDVKLSLSATAPKWSRPCHTSRENPTEPDTAVSTNWCSLITTQGCRGQRPHQQESHCTWFFTVVKTTSAAKDSSWYSCVPKRDNLLHENVGLRLVQGALVIDVRFGVARVGDAVIQVVRH